MKDITSKQTGFGLLSPKQTFAVILAVMCWGLSVSTIWLLRLPTALVLIVLVILGGILAIAMFVFVFNAERFDRTLLWWTFFVRELRGKTITHQLTLDKKAIEKLVPIKLHNDGMFEYLEPKDQYGVLFRYHPAENRKESIEDTNARIERLVHNFSNDLWASFHFSHTKDTSTVVEDAMLEALNQEDASHPQKKHIFGMYNHITTKAADRTTTTFLMSLRLGTFKNAKTARRAYMSHVPGLLKTMEDGGIYSKRLVAEDDIIGELSQFAILEEM